MDRNSRITGRFYDRANKSGGTIDGTVSGSTVVFTRNNGEQDYKLTLEGDGRTMSGFFVGIHDGSVDTEVTMTRKDEPAAAADGFTPWKRGEEFGRDMERVWKDRLYPTVVEGRKHEGRSEFRARLKPFPQKVWWFFWWYDQPAGAYEEHRKKMIADGFREISLQVFMDHEGVLKYQTCWIKYGS